MDLQAGDLRQAVDLLQDVALAVALQQSTTLELGEHAGDVLPERR